MVAVLNESVRLVALQFNFSNPRVVPRAVKQLERETADERDERKSHATGVLVIQPTKSCSLVEFLGELETAGYELVDAFHKERIDPKDPRGKQTYYMVRFLFARPEFVDLSDEFREIRGNIRAVLLEICEQAMWRVRGFLNPFFKGGEEVPDQKAISINLEAREPLFQPDGQPVVVWQGDERGRKIGEAPQPLQPKYNLRVNGEGAIRLMIAR